VFVNKTLFFAITAVVAIVAGATLWCVLSVDEQKYPGKTIAAAQSADVTTDNATDDVSHDSHTAEQPSEDQSRSATEGPGAQLKGLPDGTRDLPLHMSLPSLTDDKIIALIYGSSSKFASSGEILCSTDFSQDNKFKHIFVSTVDAKSESGGRYTAYLFTQSGAMWTLEAKAVRPYRQGTVVRWRRIGRETHALVEKIKARDQSQRSVELGVYTLSGTYAQCMLKFAQTTGSADTLDARIFFKRSLKPIWSAYVMVYLNSTKAKTTHFVYKYGEYISMGQIPASEAEALWKNRGLTPTDAGADKD